MKTSFRNGRPLRSLGVKIRTPVWSFSSKRASLGKWRAYYDGIAVEEVFGDEVKLDGVHV
jgi:hypothetical protein